MFQLQPFAFFQAAAPWVTSAVHSFASCDTPPVPATWYYMVQQVLGTNLHLPKELTTLSRPRQIDRRCKQHTSSSCCTASISGDGGAVRWRRRASNVLSFCLSLKTALQGLWVVLPIAEWCRHIMMAYPHRSLIYSCSRILDGFRPAFFGGSFLAHTVKCAAAYTTKCTMMRAAAAAFGAPVALLLALQDTNPLLLCSASVLLDAERTFLMYYSYSKRNDCHIFVRHIVYIYIQDKHYCGCLHRRATAADATASAAAAAAAAGADAGAVMYVYF